MTDSAAVVFAFLELLLADREQGRVRTLAEYQARFPGHEATVAREHARVDGADEADERRRIGAYVLHEMLGRGGQGEVFRAEDTRLGRSVALKVLDPGAARSAVLRERFRREAEVASRLDHPGICTVYEAGEVDGAPFVAMRYVEGRTLAQVIAADRDPARDADPPDRDEVLARCRTIASAARALHAAHEAGVVHRDVKPSNLMLPADGGVVVLDFGLAGDLTGAAPTLTATGDLHGTPAYMSPEQLAGDRAGVDRRTDVWSLGVTLYELLAGVRPFDAPTREGLFRAILSDTPAALRRAVPAAPRDLAVVLATAMERDLDRRYRTAEAFADDLDAVVASRPIRARPPTTTERALRYARREPAQVMLGAGLLVALLGAAALLGFLGARRGELAEGRRALRAVELERLLQSGMSRYQITPVLDRLEEILRAEPGYDDLRIHVALFCLDRDQFERGLAHCAGATTPDGGAALARLRVACLRGLGRDDEADAAAAELAEPRGWLDLYARGALRQRDGREADAARDLTLAIERSPRAEALVHFRRIVNLMGAGDEATLAAADTLEELFPDSALAWFYIGSVRGGRHDLTAARAAFERAVALEPNLADAWLSLGLAHVILGDLDAAHAAFARARAIATPEAWRISGGVGLVYSRAGMHSDAIEPLEAALAQRPELTSERAALGRSLLALERYHDAVQALRLAATALPDDPELARDLERALAGAGE